MKLSFKKWWDLLKATFKEFSADDTWTLGAALSYYTVFSLAPLLLIIITAAGIIFGKEAVQGEIYGQVKDFLGSEGATQVQDMVKLAYQPENSILMTVIGIGTLLFGATTVFYQLQNSLNRIWEVKPKPKKGYIKYIKDRFLSFSLILGIGFLLLVSFVLSAALSALSKFLMSYLPEYSIYLFRLLDIVLSLFVFSGLFAMIYKYLPDAKVRWHDVWIGAFVTALLFALGRFLIGLYIGKAGIASAYGAAGSIVLILVWVSYSSQILFFGAEFTQVYARSKGRTIEPRQYAVRTKIMEVEQQEDENTDKFEEKVGKVEEICEIGETSEEATAKNKVSE